MRSNHTQLELDGDLFSGLNEAQEGNLAIVFRIAKDMEMKLDDLKDLRLMLQYVANNREEYTTTYGNITPQSIGVIQRSLLTLENQGADQFFGLPELDIHDFLLKCVEGHCNILVSGETGSGKTEFIA